MSTDKYGVDSEAESRIEKLINEKHAIATKPLEWLKRADEIFTEAMQQLSAAIIQDCDSAEVARIHEWAKRSEASLKMFKDNARERAMAFILQSGKVVTEKGTLELEVGDGFVQRAIPTNTKPDHGKTERMLRAKGLSLDEHMDKLVSYEANDNKLRRLLDGEEITQAEYKSCFGELAYRVMPLTKVEEDSD